ncbi:MAG: hypothetical protein ACK5IQ_08885 [Bacteroidales bacterium]
MKKIITIFIISVFVLYSCDVVDPLGKYDLTKAESAESIKKVIGDKVAADDLLSGISFIFNNSESFTSKAFVMNVIFAKSEGNNESKQIQIDLASGKADEKTSRFANGSISYKQFDFNKISSHISTAISMIPEEYNYKGIGDYKMIAKDSYVEHQFTLQITEKSGSTEVKGGSIVTNYYELGFISDADGNLIMEEED